MLTSSAVHLFGYDVIDPDINFSDHLPIMSCFKQAQVIDDTSNKQKCASESPIRLRWDQADLLSYYQFSRIYLEPILDRINMIIKQFENKDYIDYLSHIDQLHNDIINVLSTGAKLFVPHHRANFYKFWWDQEMDELKLASIDSNKVWKAAGKPRQGPIFEKRQKCRLLYRSKLRNNQELELSSYSNDLHDALLAKNGKTFWKCWNSKFESHYKCDGSRWMC
jgi:hypothetical protein